MSIGEALPPSAASFTGQTCSLSCVSTDSQAVPGNIVFCCSKVVLEPCVCLTGHAGKGAEGHRSDAFALH